MPDLFTKFCEGGDTMRTSNHGDTVFRWCLQKVCGWRRGFGYIWNIFGNASTAVAMVLDYTWWRWHTTPTEAQRVNKALIVELVLGLFFALGSKHCWPAEIGYRYAVRSSDAAVRFGLVQRTLCLNLEPDLWFGSSRLLNLGLDLEEPVQQVRFGGSIGSNLNPKTFA